MKRLLIGFALGLLVCASLPSAQPARSIYGGDWSNQNRGLEPGDFKFFPYKDTYINEGLYIQIRFDDGTFLFGSFVIYKAGPYWRYGLLFTHVDSNNRRTLFKEEVPDDKVEQKGPPFLWQASDSYVRDNGAYWRIVIKCEGLDADLHFKPLAPGWKPGNGKAVLNKQKNIYFRNVLMCPAARVEGTLRINKKPYMSQGYGYLDRACQNAKPTHYAPTALSTYTMPNPKAPPEDRWFFHFTDNYSNKVFGGVRYSWLILIRNDKIVFTTQDFVTSREDFRIDPSIGEKTAFRFAIQGRSGADRIELVAQGDRIVDSLDVFSQLPSYIKKVALKFLKRPLYFRLASTVKGTLTQNGQTIPFQTLGMSGTVCIK